MRRGLAACREALQPRAVHQKNIEPSGRCRNRRRRRRNQSFRAGICFLCSPPKIVFAFNPDSRATLIKPDAKIARGRFLFWLFRAGRRRAQPTRSGHCEHIFQGQYECRTTERGSEIRGVKGTRGWHPAHSARARIRLLLIYPVSLILWQASAGSC